MDDDSAFWDRLLSHASEMQEWFQNGIVFIGGIAIASYAAVQKKVTLVVPFSHDVDFMISVADYGDLRDIEAIIPNQRLSKSQFTRDGFEFDVYVEGTHDLPVPYDEAFTESLLINNLRVASIPHLLVLKLKAYQDRRASSKGQKDQDDIFRCLLYATEFEITPESAVRLDSSDIVLLNHVVKSDAAYRLAGGNLHPAAILRDIASDGLDILKRLTPHVARPSPK